MEVTSLEPRPARDTDARLDRAVELLEAIDRRVAEALRVDAVQDIVGTLLLLLARLRTDGTATVPSSADPEAEFNELLRACIAMAGVPRHEIDPAVSAAAIIEASVKLPSCAESPTPPPEPTGNVVSISMGRRHR